jgi:hypothetical protein
VTVEGKRIAVRRPGARRRRRQSAPITAAAVWDQLRARPATERQALMRAYMGRLPAHEVARLLALSAAASRREVLERLARRDEARHE